MKRIGLLVSAIIFAALLLFPQSILFAQPQTGSFHLNGHLRSYQVYLPGNYTINTVFPVVFYLNGYYLTAQAEIDYFHLDVVADTSGFILVAPHPIDNRWNSGVGENPDYPTPDVDDVIFISALIDTLNNHYSIDLERIYACGFSNGGFMSYRLACQLSHRIAAIAPVGGLMSSGTAENCNPLRTMPVLHIHGTKDNFVPLNGSTGWYSADQTLSYWTDFNDCAQADTVPLPDLDPADGCTVQEISYSDCSNESNIIFDKVINGGHTWPGAVTYAQELGTTTMDINAGIKILNFFKKHKNPLVNMAYGKTMEISPFCLSQQDDTLFVSALLANPENHAVTVKAFIQGDISAVHDSIDLFDDGLHGDNNPSDNLWGGSGRLSGLEEGIYSVNLLTHDHTEGTMQYFHAPAKFITFGPVAYSNYSFAPDFLFYKDSVPIPGAGLNLQLTLKNQSSMATATNIAANLASLDTLVSFINSISSFEDIPAGDSLVSNSKYNILISEECPVGKEIPIEVNISSYGHVCWRDTLLITVQEPESPDLIDDVRTHKARIYPNPTNNQLTIETEQPGHHSIEITSLNGQLIFSTNMEGTSQQIDLSSFQKGVYFITIRSKDFVTTKKVIKY